MDMGLKPADRDRKEARPVPGRDYSNSQDGIKARIRSMDRESLMFLSVSLQRGLGNLS